MNTIKYLIYVLAICGIIIIFFGNSKLRKEKNTLWQVFTNSTKKTRERLPSPSCENTKLNEANHVDLSPINSITSIEKLLSKVDNQNGTVEKGGWYNPSNCTPGRKVAILIPYRNRLEHLKIFLRYMHPFLQRQKLFYRIFVIEHLGADRFNRAVLMNIGFKESMKYGTFDCFVITDIDFLPISDFNSYGCDISPKHLITAAARFDNGLPYDGYFGGVCSFIKEHYEKINGMSNLFFGWGGEDDDLFGRIKAKGFNLYRPPMKYGKFKSIEKFHTRSKETDIYRLETLRSTRERMDFDGLNTLKYELIDSKEEKLFTIMKVKVTRSMYSFLLNNCLHQRLK